VAAMAEQASEPTWKSLRKQLQEARLPVHGQWNVKGKNGKWDKESLSSQEMKDILSRQALEDSIIKQKHAVRQKVTARAHAFWHDLSRRAGEEEGRIPIIYKIGLHSASRYGLDVQLWSYQKLDAVPEGVSLRSAQELLPYKDFDNLLAVGTHIAHISDFLRLRALASENGGWFFDIDTWVVRDLTNMTSLTGHVFGSMAARPRTSGDARYWRTKYLRQPSERSYLSVPMHFPKDSKLLQELAQFTKGLVCTDTIQTIEYNDIMAKMSDLLIKHGLSIEAQEVHVFSPVAPWQD